MMQTATTECIGKKVAKTKKPFKWGGKISTVKGIVIHHQTVNLGYTFVEDDSVVECWRCLIIKPEGLT